MAIGVQNTSVKSQIQSLDRDVGKSERDGHR